MSTKYKIISAGSIDQLEEKVQALHEQYPESLVCLGGPFSYSFTTFEEDNYTDTVPAIHQAVILQLPDEEAIEQEADDASD